MVRPMRHASYPQRVVRDGRKADLPNYQLGNRSDRMGPERRRFCGLRTRIVGSAAGHDLIECVPLKLVEEA